MLPISFGVIIVGDEILSGRRSDKHLVFASKILAERGLKLTWARYIGDSPSEQASLYRETMASKDVVFSFGGIGATPDDHTRQAAALAVNRPLTQHPEATALIEQRFGESAYPDRIKMAQLPEGSLLIPNPINQVAGFSVEQHHFVPGFPEMAWPMMEWVLDQHYQGLGAASASCRCLVPDAKEGDLIALMEHAVQRFPALAFSSLPSYGNARWSGPHIEFGFTGDAAIATLAIQWLAAALQDLGYRVIHSPSDPV